jgi:hypothetical protein
MIPARHFEKSRRHARRTHGQFRDADRPDRFVWMRGFRDMPARRQALEAFYGGPAWARHRDAANATMIDSDDVLLLRLATPAGMRQGLRTTPRPPATAPQSAPSATAQSLLYSMLVLPLAAPVDPSLRQWAGMVLLPRLQRAGNVVEAVFETDYAPNDFPRLPVRTGEHVLAVLSRGAAGFAPDADANVAADGSFLSGLRAPLAGAPAFLRLQPTARSLLR